jgi:hypothetical protein
LDHRERSGADPSGEKTDGRFLAGIGEALGKRIKSPLRDDDALPVLSTWGYDVARVIAEFRFIGGKS